MKILLIILSVIGLGLTIIPSVLVFIQDISLDSHKQLMLIGMILWFATAPFWIKEQEL
ncbi:hypothetical protein [Rhodohalobacter sulfatireducens]|uniref:Uncharacterized protein n=1 Tax=Rhodohalobacter sulfatireducens TaxID=2911366 RepID=A0ABS9KFX6_9BACT|nr:hypothetical protein [Rhodohalobacter sulfatireducens]MCG2589748.1 hypothetical protein [Rhodohalobacter sulfatireducens]MDR9365598.1 hypothetical protein [Balneolaceae bacterium]MDR9410529.1 hypothetical protein [Balneolaceae bacterium]